MRRKCLKFHDTEFMTAEEKRLVLRDWRAFIAGDFKRLAFTKRLYSHLILHCGFIAHYDQDGFYAHYFEAGTDRLQRFLDQFDRQKGCCSAEFGDAGWYSGPRYRDLSGAMVDAMTPYLKRIRRASDVAALQAARKELRELRRYIKALEARIR